MSEKRSEFVSAAEGRTKRAIKNIQLIADLSDPSKYEYTMEDVAQIKEAISCALDAMQASYKAAQRPDFKL